MSETKPSGPEFWVADHRWIARGVYGLFLTFAVTSFVWDLVHEESRWWVAAGQALLWTGFLILHGISTPKRVDKWRANHQQAAEAATD